jgi:hypothetical protein
VVREAGPELLFLDETAWARLKKNRIILVTILLAITACIMAAILLFA